MKSIDCQVVGSPPSPQCTKQTPKKFEGADIRFHKALIYGHVHLCDEALDVSWKIWAQSNPKKAPRKEHTQIYIKTNPTKEDKVCYYSSHAEQYKTRNFLFYQQFICSLTKPVRICIGI